MECLDNVKCLDNVECLAWSEQSVTSEKKSQVRDCYRISTYLPHCFNIIEYLPFFEYHSTSINSVDFIWLGSLNEQHNYNFLANRWINAALKLAQRPNINPALGQRVFVFAGFRLAALYFSVKPKGISVYFTSRPKQILPLSLHGSVQVKSIFLRIKTRSYIILFIRLV